MWKQNNVPALTECTSREDGRLRVSFQISAELSTSLLSSICYRKLILLSCILD